MTLQFLASLLDPNIFQGSGLFLFSLVITGLSIFTLHYLFILQTSFNLQILLKKKTGHFFLSGFLITTHVIYFVLVVFWSLSILISNLVYSDFFNF